MSDFDSNPLLANDPDYVPPAPAPVRVPPREDNDTGGYRPIPASARKQVARPAEAPTGDEPTVIDAIVEDASPPKLPADAPRLWPYLKLPFRERADFFRAYERLIEHQDLIKELRADGGRTASASRAAKVFELYAVMDDLLSLCAIDQSEYRAWVASHDDEAFAQLFAAFMSRSQPGEASGSAS